MDYLQQLIERYPVLSGIQDNIAATYRLMADTFAAGGKVLIAGNGGSAADSDHIVGELMKGFLKKRPLSADFTAKLQKLTDIDTSNYIARNIQQGLPAIALSAHTALTTACINDIDGSIIYAQQVYGYGQPGDLFLGISTSGNAKNVLYAMITAKARGLKAAALTGGTGGEIAKIADVAVIVPETETYRVQELHLPVYHALCLMLEEHFFP
ncbi:phosphoheptose isomerase [Treponema primitia ZAS-2]|uniref:Phosphoheptose isomerase n=1 Tax=Treponema primitia (strain ATCC BAA-887 / DSM 12427 / ZAS-2) TaxID=545694 RepID=F5YHI2_TREPZ|nr:SIS domain-containing protein [Treponema primitia]AEF84176.1 phosphoheptose isomerase [Treponema primitia ZAS-2]